MPAGRPPVLVAGSATECVITGASGDAGDRPSGLFIGPLHGEHGPKPAGKSRCRQANCSRDALRVTGREARLLRNSGTELRRAADVGGPWRRAATCLEAAGSGLRAASGELPISASRFEVESWSREAGTPGRREAFGAVLGVDRGSYSVAGLALSIAHGPVRSARQPRREALPGLFALGEEPTAGQLTDWLPDRWLLRRRQDGRFETRPQVSNRGTTRRAFPLIGGRRASPPSDAGGLRACVAGIVRSAALGGERGEVGLAGEQELPEAEPPVTERLVQAQQEQVVLDPAFGERAPITFRRDANSLTAFSALLLFHGTPSWSRKVNSLSRFFSKPVPVVPRRLRLVRRLRSGVKNCSTSCLCLPRWYCFSPYRSIVAIIGWRRAVNRAASCFRSSSNGFFSRSSLMSRIRWMRHFCCGHSSRVVGGVEVRDEDALEPFQRVPERSSPPASGRTRTPRCRGWRTPTRSRCRVPLISTLVSSAWTSGPSARPQKRLVGRPVTVDRPAAGCSTRSRTAMRDAEQVVESLRDGVVGLPQCNRGVDAPSCTAPAVLRRTGPGSPRAGTVCRTLGTDTA